jgi:hypothetical protein
MRSILVLAAATILAPHALAQGTFTVYGQGCAPSGGSSCIAANTTGTFGGNIGAAANFALPVTTGNTASVVCGVELYCALSSGSPVNMNFWIYDATPAGTPNSIISTTTMPVSTNLQWNRANLTTPLILLPNTTFFIVFDNRVGLRLPIMSSGTRNVHYWNGPPTWNGPFTSGAWNYQVICCGGGPTPTISSTGVPTVNASYSVDLASAPLSANAFFAVGVTRLNVDLAIMGAPGCSLYTNPLVIFGLTTDSAGASAFKIGVPNDARLIGFTFFTQYAIADATANGAGIVFTAGGENKVG